MKLLFITSRFPYPYEKGDKLRSYYFLKHLSVNNEIILISLNEKPVEQKNIEKIKEIVSKVYVFPLSRFSRYLNSFLALFKYIPLQAGYFFNPKVKKNIKQVIDNEKPEHIFCQLLRIALYVKKINIPKTIDYQDAFSYGVKRRIDKSKFPMSLILRLEYSKLKNFEQRIFNWFDNRIIITETDKHLLNVKEKSQVHVVSNGVDIEYFDYTKFPNCSKKYDLLFTGNMNYPPNIYCALYIAKKILPLIKIKFPNIKIAFVGANPHPLLKKLSNENIEVTGWVEDMRSYYASSHVFIAPMQLGTGLQNKLLEAMAMRMPCITSELANSGLNAEHMKHIIVCKTTEEICNFTETLLTNTELSDFIASNAFEYVKHTFSWKTQAEKLNRIMTNTHMSEK